MAGRACPGVATNVAPVTPHEQLSRRWLVVKVEDSGEELRHGPRSHTSGERDDSGVTFGKADGVSLGDTISALSGFLGEPAGDSAVGTLR